MTKPSPFTVAPTAEEKAQIQNDLMKRIAIFVLIKLGLAIAINLAAKKARKTAASGN